MNSPYRAYIKDCLNLNSLPTHFLTVISGDPSGDILTNASSSFDCLEEIPDTVREGDVFCLYDPDGQVIYQGVIKAKEDKRIQCDQIYALFDQDWFTRIQKETYLEHEIADVFTEFQAGKIGEIVTSLPTANEDNWLLNKNYFVLDNNVYKEHRINQYEEDGQITYQMDEVGELDAADIDLIVDPMQVQKFSAFTVTYTGSQEVHMTVPDDINELRNLEDFIYSLYEDYGVVVEITIPYESGCTIHIKTADYDSTKISKNTSNIISITPKTETEEINKLVIFGSQGNFRKTYYATTEGVVTDGEDTNRLPVIKTTYIYSDDELDDIKAENIKDEMYNHEIVFDMIMDNKLYDFFAWKFGQPLEIYYKDKVYNSIFTGYSYSFDEGERPVTVTVNCGKIRTKLTDKLNKGGGV